MGASAVMTTSDPPVDRWPSRSIDRRRLPFGAAGSTARCSMIASTWSEPGAKSESEPAEVTSRTRSWRRAVAITMLAAADTATSSESPWCAAFRTMSSTVVRPCQGSSFCRTSSSSWRADDGQWIRRRSSPMAYGRRA